MFGGDSKSGKYKTLIWTACNGNMTWKPPCKQYGCFRKWWYPQTIQFDRVFHYKSSILGFWGTPIFGNTHIEPFQVILSISQFCRWVKAGSSNFPKWLDRWALHNFSSDKVRVLVNISFQCWTKIGCFLKEHAWVREVSGNIKKVDLTICLYIYMWFNSETKQGQQCDVTFYSLPHHKTSTQEVDSHHPIHERHTCFS